METEITKSIIEETTEQQIENKEDSEQQFPDNDLNREKFDYIVFGSGLTENILGA